MEKEAASGFTGQLSHTVSYRVSENTLYIEGKGEVPDFGREYHAPWYGCRRRILKLSISDGITRLGQYAFHGCAFSSVTLPASLFLVSAYAFYRCDLLQVISFPSSKILEIMPRAFYKCYSLSTLAFSRGLKRLHPGALLRCPLLTRIYYEGTAEEFETAVPTSDWYDEDLPRPFFEYGWAAAPAYLPDGDFYYTVTEEGDLLISGHMPRYRLPELTPWYGKRDKILRVVTLSDATVCPNAFFGYPALRVAVLPHAFEIGESAFYNCNRLCGLQLSYRIKRIEKYAFFGCPRLFLIDYEGDEEKLIPQFKGRWDTGLSKEKLWIRSVKETEGKVIAAAGEGLPPAPMRLGYLTPFAPLSPIILPQKPITLQERRENEKKYGSMPFSLAATAENEAQDALSYTLDENGVLTLLAGEATFSERMRVSPFHIYRKTVKHLVVKEGVSRIGEKEFSLFPTLESVTVIGDTEIGDSAFSSCSSLREVRLFSAVTRVGRFAFGGASALTGVCLGLSVRSFAEGVFYACGKLKNLLLPTCLTEVETGCLADCPSLENIKFIGNAEEYGEGPFAGVTDWKMKQVLPLFRSNGKTVDREADVMALASSIENIASRQKQKGDRLLATVSSIDEAIGKLRKTLDDTIASRHRTALLLYSAKKEGRARMTREERSALRTERKHTKTLEKELVSLAHAVKKGSRRVKPQYEAALRATRRYEKKANALFEQEVRLFPYNKVNLEAALAHKRKAAEAKRPMSDPHKYESFCEEGQALIYAATFGNLERLQKTLTRWDVAYREEEAPRAPRILLFGDPCDPSRSSLCAAYAEILSKEGATVVSYTGKEEEKDFDGLLLVGRSEALCGTYHKEESSIPSEERARLAKEEALFRSFFLFGKPIFGIGRGHQLINLLLGGEVAEMPLKLYQKHGGDTGAHKVYYDPASFLGESYRSDRYETKVTGRHRRLVTKLGEGMRTVAFTMGKEIEASQHEKLPVFGIQFEKGGDYRRDNYPFLAAFANVCQTAAAKPQPSERMRELAKKHKM